MKLKSSFIFSSLCLIAVFLVLPGCGGETSGEEKVLAQSLTTDAELPSLKDKKVLLVHGGWPGHKPALFAEIMTELLEAEGAEVSVYDTLSVYADSVLMNTMDLIIQSITMDKITKEQIRGLVKAVKSGVGFAGAHGGFCDAFRNNTQYQYMTGGQFVAHPGGQINYTVNISNQDDPIIKGIEDFETKTEQYYMHVDPNVKVLATTTYDGKYDDWVKGAVVPVAWKKYFGKGRIFYLAIGHDPAEFKVEPAQQFLMNGFRWASASKYTPIESWLSPVYQN